MSDSESEGVLATNRTASLGVGTARKGSEVPKSENAEELVGTEEGNPDTSQLVLPASGNPNPAVEMCWLFTRKSKIR